ncbi:DUF5132 domain-containing protein [Paenibacillus elgii]|uniref:DUF5132 domain-containing protein n=1 Tax=Paenibacillus elgii TaxID=189691 RepID=UPI001F3047F6|nr:DUF5132 domain-containing protein [Paenibacillus elgii]
MREQQIEKWLVGAALAFAASALLPVVKTTLLPVAEAGYQGLRSAAGAARSSLQRAREELEDIVAEAQFERMKKKLDLEIASSGDEFGPVLTGSEAEEAALER